jgi:hypothetical protein
MLEFEQIGRNEVPDARGGHASQFTEALDAALANPDAAIKLSGLSQRERNRLVQITSTTAKKNNATYAGKVEATVVRNADATYDVYLTKVETTSMPTATTNERLAEIAHSAGAEFVLQ